MLPQWIARDDEDFFPESRDSLAAPYYIHLLLGHNKQTISIWQSQLTSLEILLKAHLTTITAWQQVEGEAPGWRSRPSEAPEGELQRSPEKYHHRCRYSTIKI